MSCLKEFAIPTGSIDLDRILSGGIRYGLTEIFGASGSGKTQMCIELAMNTITPKPLGLVAGSVVYISSQKSLLPERILTYTNRIVKAYNLQDNKIQLTVQNLLQKILYKQVFNLGDLTFTIHYLKTYIKNDPNIRLIVIDSFSTHMRDLEPIQKLKVSHELAGVLSSIASKTNCAVILTNEMTVQFDPHFRKRMQGLKPQSSTVILRPALGQTFDGRCARRFYLLREQKFVKVSVLKNGLSKGGVANIFIDSQLGIVDYKDDVHNAKNDDNEKDEVDIENFSEKLS